MGLDKAELDRDLTGGTSKELQAKQKSALCEVLDNHSIDVPINELGHKFLEIVKTENTPLALAHEKLSKTIAKHEETLGRLKNELNKGNCGWHEARNDSSWAQDSKGKHFDAMRTDIKEAMSHLSSMLVETITGESGQFRAVGTEGYKSDIDLTYLPDKTTKNFSYASAKLVFDSVFASTFNRLPEDLLDLEVYIQHPGLSLHTGEELKTNEGIKRYRQEDIQAAFVKVESEEVLKHIQGCINDHMPLHMKAGLASMIEDTTLFQEGMRGFRKEILGDIPLDATGGKFSEGNLKRDFAEASFRDTLICSLYKENIQNLQDDIDQLEREIDFGLNSSGGSISRNTSSGLSRLSTNRESDFEVQRSGNSGGVAPKSRMGRPSGFDSYFELPLEVQSSAGSISRIFKKEISRTSSHFDRELEVQKSGASSSPNAQVKMGLAPNKSGDLEAQVSGGSILRGLSSLKFPFRQASELPLFQTLLKPLMTQRTGAPLNRMKSRMRESEQRKLETLDDLRVQQAMFGTFTESLTKEGFNSQGALRDIVENRDGQEDTKNAKVLSKEILNLELQNREIPRMVDQLLHQKVPPDFYSKIADHKKGSSAGSLLSSAVENFHFYCNHMHRALQSQDAGKAADAAINESKYQLRFVTRALELYEELNKSQLGDFDGSVGELRELLKKAEDLEKMKRQEQLPMSAFIRKIEESRPLPSSFDARAIFESIAPLKTLRLNDYFQSSMQVEGTPQLNTSALTNVKFYKSVIDQLTGSESPFQKGSLRVGSIELPILQPRADRPTSSAESGQISDLNTWAMALSGFPSGLYALPQLNAQEVSDLRNHNVEKILEQMSARGDKLKKEVFESARAAVLEESGHNAFDKVSSSFDEISQIYGKLIANATTALGLFADKNDFENTNGFQNSFSIASNDLLERVLK